jgi:hypothetical protein
MKGIIMQKTIHYFTKKLLAKANAIAIKRGYNRALMDDFVDGLSDKLKYPVCYHIVHRHKRGEACEPHIRVFIATDDEGSTVALDCELNLFQTLPAVGVGSMIVSNT